MPTADKIVTESQIKRLLREMAREKDLAAESGRGFKFVIDYFAVIIAYHTGLRISELLALTWADISPEYLIVRCGKGGKSRTVYYGEKTAAILSEFKTIQQRFNLPCRPEDHLFIGQRGPLERCAIHLRFKYWIKRVGLPDSLSFHSLRHGYGTRLLDSGIPLSTVRDQLGHVIKRPFLRQFILQKKAA